MLEDEKDRDEPSENKNWHSMRGYASLWNYATVKF